MKKSFLFSLVPLGFLFADNFQEVALDKLKNKKVYSMSLEEFENLKKQEDYRKEGLIEKKGNLQSSVKEVVLANGVPIVEGKKDTTIVNFSQLYVFINDGKPNNSTNTSGKVDYGNNVKKDDSSQNTSVLGDEDLSKVNDLNFIKEKIFELAKISNKVDLLFLKERLRETSTLEAVKKLIQELERI